MRTDLLLCFKDEGAALSLVEAHVWPDGVVCPHCGETRRTGLLRGPSTVPGTRKCYRCRRLFSVRSGTIFECSHVPLHKWLQAFFLTGCGRETIKPYHLSQTINVSFKTAALMIEEIKRSAAACELRSTADETEAASQPPAHRSSADASRTALDARSEFDAETN